MDVEIELPGIHKVIPKGLKVAGSRHGRIEVTNRASSSISAVGENRFAGKLTLNINIVQRLLWHIDFAADFERTFFGNMHRNRVDRDHVRGHIFARHTIAASHSVLELAIIVDERHP